MMNKILPALIAAFLLAATSFSTLAATEVNIRQAAGLQSLGNVSVSGLNGTMGDMTTQLAKEAEARGASYYRIIREDNPGDSHLWSGNAEIYR